MAHYRHTGLRGAIMDCLADIYPNCFTCKQIANWIDDVTPRQIYDCIRNMPLDMKQDLHIIYGSGLFQPNKYGVKK